MTSHSATTTTANKLRGRVRNQINKFACARLLQDNLRSLFHKSPERVTCSVNRLGVCARTRRKFLHLHRARTRFWCAEVSPTPRGAVCALTIHAKTPFAQASSRAAAAATTRNQMGTQKTTSNRNETQCLRRCYGAVINVVYAIVARRLRKVLCGPAHDTRRHRTKTNHPGGFIEPPTRSLDGARARASKVNHCEAHASASSQGRFWVNICVM